MRRALALVLMAIASASVLGGAAAAQDAGAAIFRATTLDISAEGEVKAVPDQATISLGVRTSSRTAAAAMRANRELMNTTLAALAAQGVQKRDIQTSNLNLNAQYTYEPNQSPRLTGYQADNEVTIVVRDLARLGQTVDAVTTGGANQINGVSFGLSDPAPVQDEARRAAVKALRARADLYAQAEGLRVVRLVNLAEGDAPRAVQPRMVSMRAMASPAAPTPMEPGELNVVIRVSATYELGQ